MSQRVKVIQLSGFGRNAIRLVCFPYAGGGVSVFRSWPKILPSSVAVYAASLPGREERLHEPPFDELEPLVACSAGALLPRVDRPFAFFGHCMGALVAFEVAHRLRRLCAVSPVHLFVSGFRAPQLPDPRPISYNLAREKFFRELRRLGGLVDDGSDYAELMELMLPTLRADCRIVQTYSHVRQTPLVCPITAYGGLSDPDIGMEQLQGWGEHTSGRFTVKRFPGNHFFVHPERQRLLEDMHGRLGNRAE